MNDSCPSALNSFSSFYQNYVHFYLCLAIGIVGSVFNIINIIVFTWKNMASPTNVVLTWLAVADLALLLSYIVRLVAERLVGHLSFSVRFCIVELFALARFISLWMTVVLAVWRYLSVVHPWEAKNWCDMKTTYRTVVAVYVLCSLVAFVDIIIQQESVLQFQTAFHYSGLFFIPPCIALPILTIGLVYELRKGEKRSQKLMSSTVQQNASDLDREIRTNHTTRILLVVLILFLIATLPRAIYYLTEYLRPIVGLPGYRDCFKQFLHFCIMLILLKAASNFLVYYVMSCKFRKTCYVLFNCNAFTAAKTILRIEARNENTAEIIPV